MTTTIDQAALVQRSRQALLLWGVFIVLVVVINGTIPFLLGADLHAWTGSTFKSILLSFVVYAVLFLAVPLVLIKGWETVRKPSFLYPLCLAMAAVSLWQFLPGAAALAVLALAYLHRRFDLSDYGIRSHGWKGDLLAILIIGLLGFFPLLMRSLPHSLSWGAALPALVSRLFTNPASTVENLFYYGFLTERLSYRTGRWLTPLLIGLMYTAHELSNPEYWYGNMSFVLIFVGVTIWASIYLWRRSAVVIWLGDGLYRFAG
jgi:hypothetical protein